jgi:hypothetical protein
LVDFLLDRRIDITRLGDLVASEALLSAFDVDHIAPEALLFQTGYLTIDSTRRVGAMTQYRLRWPNLEVRASLNGALLERMSPDPGRSNAQAAQLYDLLLANDFAGLERLFKALFTAIPHQWHVKNPIADYEGYYASVFYAYFASLGLDITAEDSNSAGRLDMALRFNGHIYLFEFKVVELTPEGSALQQIKDRGYADKYRAAASRST